MKEAGHPLGPLVNTKHMEKYLMLLHQQGKFKAWEDSDGKFMGSVGCSITPLWWTDGEFGLNEEFVIGVSPGFGRIALAYFESVAHEFDCALISAGNTLGMLPQQTVNMYMRKGKYDLNVNNFIKVLIK